MKRLFIIVSASVMLFTSCWNQSGNNSEETKAQSPEEEYLTKDLLIKMDSLVSEMSKLNMDPVFLSLENGELAISEKEKLVKPSYLMPLSRASQCVTLSQKYRATMIYRMDMAVAELYEMPLTGYKQTIAKLIVEINNPAFKVDINEDSRRDAEAMKNFITKVYKEEEEAGTINFFWDAMVAALIEDLYIATMNIDKFIPCFNDRTASEVTYRFILVHQALEDLIPYHPELKNLQSIMEPLKVINAIDVRQLKAQLISLKNDIAMAREKLLK